MQSAFEGHHITPLVHGSSRLLRDPTCWQSLPTSSLGSTSAGVAFRILSTSACCAHQYLRDRHQRYPFKLFKLLSPGEVLDDPRCCLDAFSESFLKRHGDIGPDAMAELDLLGSLMRLNTIGIELGHAHIRRILECRSVHAKKAGPVCRERNVL